MTRTEFHGKIANLVNRAPESLDELADFLRSLVPEGQSLRAMHWRVAPNGNLSIKSWEGCDERTDPWYAVRSRLLPPPGSEGTWYVFTLMHDGLAACTVCNGKGMDCTFTLDTFDESRDILEGIK